MPTIVFHPSEFERLLAASRGKGMRLTPAQLEALLPLVKGEFKGQDSETGEWRVELQDSNRPDLWCCEGIARQVRTKRAGRPPVYPFFHTKKPPTRQVRVARGMDKVRPYVAACAALGYEVTQSGLAQLIQTQEKLADIFGRKRRTVSIGVYRLPAIQFPVTYDLVDPNGARFTPLGMDTPMTLGEILMVHPKGLEYGSIVSGGNRLPVLRDEVQQVLSFPPIINSREIGEVRVGDQDLFIEVTGTDLHMVVLALNIFAVNLSDRGAKIEPVEVHYPYQTPLGKRVRTPGDFGQCRRVPFSAIGTALGESLKPTEVRRTLRAYGYDVSTSGQHLTVKLPPYRNDLMHTVDVVEDVAICRGYDSFTPEMPQQFTVGGLSQIEQRSDRMRDLMVGLGYQEVISNILGSRQEYVERMRVQETEWGQVVEVDNVMSLNYACLRPSLLPSLLRVESASGRAFYPHRLFEAGEVAHPNSSSAVGSDTRLALGVLAVHAGVTFSELHSALDLLLYYAGYTYELRPLTHPSFLEGRAGEIVVKESSVGYVGELHPEVLDQWQITVPAAAFELDLSALPNFE
ncbi:phenylalanine--tRNA ligase beta subunit [Nitrospira sp.]|nr:phenylalanine--tRNA ligase beta subunit [Nitrospira sp.]